MEYTWENLDRLMRRIPDVVLVLMGLAIIAGITAFKLTLGQSVPLVDFLLIPVVWVGWFASARWYGYLLATVAAVVSGVVAVMGTSHASAGAAGASAVARLLLYLVILELLGMMRRERASHQRAAATDQRTGLANAGAFQSLAQAELLRSRRYGHPLSLALIDLDDFKSINDTFGHGEGDHLLSEVGHVLLTMTRSTDVVARIGGDEFAILMPETGAEQARFSIERLRCEFDRLRVGNGQKLSCSIGLVTFGRAPEALSELTRAADELMYEAKRTGKGKVAQSQRAGKFSAGRPRRLVADRSPMGSREA